MKIKRYKLRKLLISSLIFLISFSLIFINFAGSKIIAADAITVFLDAGHGGSDSGCVHNGLTEKEVNLKITLKLRDLLKSNGFNVIMRRADDSGMSLDDIVNTANKSGADLFLSIHNNASLTPASSGTETYWSSNGVSGSSQFAASVQSNLVSAIGSSNRGVKSADFRVIKNTKMTAALVECVFVSNPDEAKLLKDDNFLNKIAKGLFNGISNHAKNVTPNTNTQAAENYKATRVLVGVDVPQHGQEVSGIFQLEGWALEQSGVTSPEIDAVHVYDGPAAGSKNMIGIATYGIARPDVADNFGNNNFKNCGYGLNIDSSRLSKGRHVLHIYAHNSQLGWGYTTLEVNVIDGVSNGSDTIYTPAQGSTDATITDTTTDNDNNTTTNNGDQNYESSGEKKVLISIDTPKNNQNVSGVFELAGWAIEQSAVNSTGITAVHVYDGKANGSENMLGIAKYGASRDDVADSFSKGGFKNCGFNLKIDSSKLSSGSHTLYIYAYNHYLGWKYTTLKINVNGGASTEESQNNTYLSENKSQDNINSNSQAYLSSGIKKVLINIDTPSASQSVSGSFELAGWAVEQSAVNSTGITAIHVYNGRANGEGNMLGVATYGMSRDDVSNYFGKANLKNSGFRLNIDSSKLSNGNNTLYVYAYSPNLGWKYSTVQVQYGGGSSEGSTQANTATQNTNNESATYVSSGNQKVLINIDTPSASQSVSKGFELAGWAVEQSATNSTGITAIHIYDGPANGQQNMLGVAEYGISRKDVASNLGNSNFKNSGFRINIDGSKLTNGKHTLYVYAHNPNIGWKYMTLNINYTGSSSSASNNTNTNVITNSTNMVGYQEVTAEQLVRIFEIRGSSKVNWARRLAPLYIKWGQKFNIRADIAWAMMCHETGFLEFGGVVRPDWNNFCGLGATGPEGVGARFDSEELGIIAQYAHLAWYVYPSHVNDYCSKTYDPRHSDSHYFNGNSAVGTLNGRWAPGSTYTDKILLFANQIYGN